MLVTRRNAPDSRSSLIYGTEVESANSTRKAGPLVMRLSYVAQNTRSQRYVFMRPLLESWSVPPNSPSPKSVHFELIFQRKLSQSLRHFR
jgi:hypothetical protein